MGREARRRAAQAAQQKTSHQAPPPGLERRHTLVEQFATEHVQVLEVLPEEDASVDTAQVGVQLVGRPAFHTRAGKVYLTFFTPELAIQVGEGLAESGRVLAQRAVATTSSGLVLSGSMAEAAAVARQAEQAEALRG